MANSHKQRAQEFFTELKANVRVLAGNKQVAQAVARGELAFGLTDTDDAIIEQEALRPVSIVYPDQGENQLGTLLIPNTVVLISGAKNVQAGQRLVDFLLSPSVERKLAEGPSAQFPLNPKVRARSRVDPQRPLREMQVDFQAAAEQWDTAATFLRELFAAVN